MEVDLPIFKELSMYILASEKASGGSTTETAELLNKTQDRLPEDAQAARHRLNVQQFEKENT